MSVELTAEALPVSILDMAEELEPTEGFDFRIMDRTFKFRNLTGFSQRKNFQDGAKAFAKSARSMEFQKKLLETLPDIYTDEKKAEVATYLKTRQIDDWDLAYQFENLSVEPKLSTLEAIMLTKVTMFVDNFTFLLSVNQSKGIESTFAAMVEAEKKDLATTDFGS